ncbi:MAG: 3-phosphoshikimate 1-carboxyvinyltransferase [Candidatus Omnitrophica bacterium]|nr:3-phosphoshikimate 1-carboxyvinyltransferase [Candidatus Omnitrophota bacterium]
MPSKVLNGPSCLKGIFVPPGDKSISHRAVMFGALAEGQSSFTHFLEAEDCLRTLTAFECMGVPMGLEKGTGRLTVDGVGLSGLCAPKGDLDMGNSGTSMRILLGILAGQRFKATLTGDPSLSSRPMRRVTQPLKKMGAQIKGRDNGNFAPLVIHGGRLKGIDFVNELSSAQVKSALLFAGLYAEGQTRIQEFIPSRDHTERFLRMCGAPLRQEGEWLVVEKAVRLSPLHMAIPGDISAAAFFLVGAAMTPGSFLTIENVCLNPTRTGVIRVLERMGAKIEIKRLKEEPEPVGCIYTEGCRLKGTRIPKEEIPALIDELPILMVAMALAEGESLITGAHELRVKETDRIQSMVHNLNAIGGSLQELPDGCIIKGVEHFSSGTGQSFGDHRTAMSLAVASLAAEGEIRVEDIDCVATSFPAFFAEFERLKQAA